MVQQKPRRHNHIYWDIFCFISGGKRWKRKFIYKQAVPESQSGGGNSGLSSRIAALESRLDEMQAAKLDAGRVTQSVAVTEAGYAADARQLNPANAGSLAAQVASLNGAYMVTKALLEDFVCKENKWTQIQPFTYVVPQKSVVFMTVTFAYTQNRDARLDLFLANSFYSVEHLNMKDTRVQESRAFIAGRGQSLEVHVGSVDTHVTTILGSADTRYSHVDYLVVPVE